MLKVTGILAMTLKENLRGQILWTSAISGLVLLMLVSTLGGTALSHESRILDVFSYFVVDLLLLLVAIFSGSWLCSVDFSSRGIAELYIPAGVKRHSVLVARVTAHAVILILLALSLYLFKSLILPLLSEQSHSPQPQVQLSMLLFSILKSITALCIATLLGSVARPLYAILGTLTLFCIGHLTSTLDALLTTTTHLQAQSQMSYFNSLLYSLLKVWNPNLLVVESVRGAWVLPSAASLAAGILWAIGFSLAALGFTFWRINRVDIRA